MNLRIVFPHRAIIGATVAGTVDDTYQAAWLTFGDPAHPVRTTGNLSLTVTPSAALLVDILAVCHHNIRQAATITLGGALSPSGSLSSSIVTAAHPPDAIPHNWYRRLSAAVTASTLVLGVSGNTDPVIVGEFYAGRSFTFAAGVRHDRAFDPGKPFPWEGEYGLQPPYDPGVTKPRRLRLELLPTAAELEELVAGEVAQRTGSRPCLVIPDDTVNDAWLALIAYTARTDGVNHFVTLEIVEIPRVRWP